jgi:F420-non-reducing hydrogenase iron-sulfur subunit
MKVLKSENKIVVFTCNWTAYGGLEKACRQPEGYPASVRPIKVMCLGRMSPGLILKAFEKGAAGVLLLGCPPDECHYEFGNQRAEQTFKVARSLVRLLGYADACLKLDHPAMNNGSAWVGTVRNFVAQLNSSRGAQP